MTNKINKDGFKCIILSCPLDLNQNTHTYTLSIHPSIYPPPTYLPACLSCLSTYKRISTILYCTAPHGTSKQISAAGAGSRPYILTWSTLIIIKLIKFSTALQDRLPLFVPSSFLSFLHVHYAHIYIYIYTSSERSRGLSRALLSRHPGRETRPRSHIISNHII